MNKLSRMKIVLLLSILILAIYFIVKNLFYSAKRNLFKDQAAWSGKDIKINYSNSKENLESNRNNNYLKIIAEESKLYLEDQSNHGSE